MNESHAIRDEEEELEMHYYKVTALTTHEASLVAQMVHNLPECRRPGSITGLGRSPGEGDGHPLQYSGLENSMDSPWGRKESDTTEWLSLSLWASLIAQLVKNPPGMQ